MIFFSFSRNINAVGGGLSATRSEVALQGKSRVLLRTEAWEGGGGLYKPGGRKMQVIRAEYCGPRTRHALAIPPPLTWQNGDLVVGSACITLTLHPTPRIPALSLTILLPTTKPTSTRSPHHSATVRWQGGPGEKVRGEPEGRRSLSPPTRGKRGGRRVS